MRNKCLKRIVAVFLAALMCLASTVAVFAEGETPEYDEVIAIIHTNDVHGEIEVEPYVKGLADQMKKSGDYSLVLTASAGDVYSGGKAVAGYYKGELIPAIMDQVYDVIAPGNNDFNEGTDTVAQNLLLTALYKHAKTICANLVFKNGIDLPAYASAYTAAIGNADFADLYDGVKLNGEELDFSDLNLQATAAETSPYKATEVFETANETKLGLFGLSCTEGQMTGKLVGPGSIVAAQNAVAALKTQNADVIVGLAHTGWAGENTDEATSANDTNSWYLASQVQDMDALIDSHTHSIINEGKGCYVGENQVLVNQAGAYGNCIGIMKFYLKDHKVVAKTAELLTGDAVKAITPDETVQAMVDADIERVMDDVGPTLVTTPYFLNAEKASIRGRETNMGDFILDVVRNAASEKMGKDYVFASYPGFCFRTSIEANTMMTKMDIISILGYVTPIIEKEFTAQDIVDQVTWTLKAVHGSNASFYQYSGLTITYTTEPGEGSKIVGTPVTIKAGNTLIYDVNKGGIQVPSSWKALGVVMSDPNPGTPNNFDIATVDPDKIICLDKKEEHVEDRALYPFVCDYLATHELGKDYVIYPNELAPDNRIVEVPKMTYHPAVVATCEKAGHQEYWVNEETGKMYADLYGEQEIVKLAAIPPTGHKWDAGKVTKYPTTKTTGTMLFTCKNDKKHTKTVTIPKLKANTIKVKVSKKAIKASALHKKAQSFKIVVTKAKGKVTITPNAKAKKAGIKVSKKGVVVLPKNCKAGTYKITVKAAGDKLKYAPGAKVVTIKVTKKGAVIKVQ